MLRRTWDSVASECTDMLGPNGYGAVRVAPPAESLKQADYYWWDVYQPYSYELSGRFGTAAEFASMVNACHDAGVKVYTDAVINHTAAQTSRSRRCIRARPRQRPTTTPPVTSWSDLESLPSSGVLTPDDSVSFVTNHDTERNGLHMSYKDGDAYRLANVFQLAYKWSTPTVYSGFEFSSSDQAPPNSNGFVTDTDCSGGWYCLHRDTAVDEVVERDRLVRWQRDPHDPREERDRLLRR
ncbi:alpha-amylase family glycosyl hydrolase [Streptomyces ferrugineus]|uniref:alpha-amylase family glycosyl hydrolase n=1 Tax=Streptomyces ferrugineus TaxID=1413221 RepID=UPI00389ACF70